MCKRNFRFKLLLGSYWQNTVAAPEFFVGGHLGGKMRFWGGKNPKICQKWLILTIFFFWGGQVGGRASNWRPPCPPWCRHWKLLQKPHTQKNCDLTASTILSFKSHGSEMYFFIFASCEPFNFCYLLGFSFKTLTKLNTLVFDFYLETTRQKHRSKLATVNVTIKLVGLLNNCIFRYQFARQTEKRINFKTCFVRRNQKASS